MSAIPEVLSDSDAELHAPSRRASVGAILSARVVGAMQARVPINITTATVTLDSLCERAAVCFGGVADGMPPWQATKPISPQHSSLHRPQFVDSDAGDKRIASGEFLRRFKTLCLDDVVARDGVEIPG